MSLIQKSKELSGLPVENAGVRQAKKVFIPVGGSAFVRPFTDQEETVKVHYLTSKGPGSQQQGYVRCLGEGCPACAAGIQPRELELLPVYNADDGEVQVLQLPVPQDERQKALSLRNQILRVFGENPETFTDILIPIDRKNAWEYVVGEPQELGDVDTGEEAVSEFTRLNEEERSVWVRSVIQELSKNDIEANFPIVKNRLRRLAR